MLITCRIQGSSPIERVHQVCQTFNDFGHTNHSTRKHIVFIWHSPSTPLWGCCFFFVYYTNPKLFPLQNHPGSLYAFRITKPVPLLLLLTKLPHNFPQLMGLPFSEWDPNPSTILWMASAHIVAHKHTHNASHFHYNYYIAFPQPSGSWFAKLNFYFTPWFVACVADGCCSVFIFGGLAQHNPTHRNHRFIACYIVQTTV